LAAVVSARIDHVILGVSDLEGSAERFLQEHGLASVEGGRHPGWGTANRIVPLGRDYIELAGIVDDTEAMGNAFGTSVRAAADRGGGLVAWCLAVDDAEAVATRTGLSLTDGSRIRPDGVTLRWRLVGLETALSEPWRPFFIEWQIAEDAHPGRTQVAHRVEPEGIAWIEVAGDRRLLDEVLGGADVEVRLGEGPPELLRVGIATKAGEVVLG
jgi:hypothetical protein